MYEWTYATLGGWLPLWGILGTAAMTMAVALLMEALIGSRILPAERRAARVAARARRSRWRGCPSPGGGSTG